jgi:hypothetical protein
VTLRPTHLLPPKRLLTPRSARHLSTTNRGLLLGLPATTQVGLTPTGLTQLPGRTIASDATMDLRFNQPDEHVEA